MSVSCHTTASTSYLHSGTGVRLTSVSCTTNVSVGLKPESPVPFGIAKPNSHFGLRTKALKNSIQSWTIDSEPTRERIKMMPTGSPQVPVTMPGQRYVQFLDLGAALYRERIIILGQYIDEDFSSDLMEMILYLDTQDTKDPILFFINSPGGDARSTFSIYDTMQSLQSPVGTQCIGTALNQAGFLLAAGDKGKRSAMPMSKIILQSPVGTARGQADDIFNETNELLRIRDLLFNELAAKTGQPVEKIYKDLEWPKSFTAEEAVEYGLIDRVARRKS
ncbi:hypothetical protein Vadar_023641 [Vaccinium darrowii]|uniref:Uncharacterized protein n=1 Tax=Vaccinium darrowii TaxID=229202 RepID=A0ACB7ZET6_9ERIC|nr:hypothetical protein Vadar_023641 [Vaccinium darrowii]